MTACSPAAKVLVLGYGNPGRLDDGLGPALVQRMESLQLPEVYCDANYQLLVEDAATIAEHEVVVFVDADSGCAAPFWFGEVTPQRALSFSSHSVSAAAVLELAHGLLGGATRGYFLGIRGYQFNGFGEGLSAQAAANLKLALVMLCDVLANRDFAAQARRYPRDPQ